MVNFAGCSPCACGIQETCPGYTTPSSLVILVIVVLAAVFTGTMYFLWLRHNKRFRKLSRTVFIIFSIISLVLVSLFTFNKINGQRQWDENLKQYHNCLNHESAVACEY